MQFAFHKSHHMHSHSLANNNKRSAHTDSTVLMQWVTSRMVIVTVQYASFLKTSLQIGNKKSNDKWTQKKHKQKKTMEICSSADCVWWTQWVSPSPVCLGCWQMKPLISPQSSLASAPAAPTTPGQFQWPTNTSHGCKATCAAAVNCSGSPVTLPHSASHSFSLSILGSRRRAERYLRVREGSLTAVAAKPSQLNETGAITRFWGQFVMLTCQRKQRMVCYFQWWGPASPHSARTMKETPVPWVYLSFRLQLSGEEHSFFPSLLPVLNNRQCFSHSENEPIRMTELRETTFLCHGEV